MVVRHSEVGQSCVFLSYLTLHRLLAVECHLSHSSLLAGLGSASACHQGIRSISIEGRNHIKAQKPNSEQTEFVDCCGTIV